MVNSLTTYFAKIQTSWSIKNASFLSLVAETSKHDGLLYRTCYWYKMMDLTGIEPVSKIHTLYNCLRCSYIKLITVKVFSVPPVSRFWTSIATTNISLFFGYGIKPPFDIQNCCLFLISGDYVTNRAQLYISKPCRCLFKPKKAVVYLPDRRVTIKWVVSIKEFL